MVLAPKSLVIWLGFCGKSGDEVQLFDGVDRSFLGVLETVTPTRVSGRIWAERASVKAPYVLRLFQGVPKGDTFEWIIEKATELGVSEIVPLHTVRSVARVPAARAVAKRARWDKIARAAAAQCGRADVPVLLAPMEFDEALARVTSDELWLIPWEGEETTTLKSVLSAGWRGSP
ncbi:MAG: RsmE family RNA methyltransferase [Elusimicrobia bacterium]|nr:RsmE family RNA methyltransferase [Elusimicrobiota bacterium]